MRIRKWAALVSLFCLQTAHAAKSATIYGVLADEPQFNATRKDFSAKGNVALLTSEGFLTGESLLSSEEGQLLTLEGNVVIIRGSELVKASRLVLDRRNGEFAIFDAEVIANPSYSSKSLVDKDFLGFTPEEIAFEAQRAAMGATIRKDLAEMREEYVHARNIERIRREAPFESSRLLERYTTLLERMLRTESATNPLFTELSPEARKRFEERRTAARQLLETHPEVAARFRSVTNIGGFTRLRAKSLIKDASGGFRVEGASITPCNCGEDGVPIYGLSARSGYVELDGYATLRGTTIEVGNVPIVYTPWLIFPAKRQRQSGFLRPYFYLSRSSRVLGVPFFLTMGDHADATFTFSDFSGRGVRYDLESRLQLSPESRFEIAGEFIRDRKYLGDSKKYQAKLVKDYESANASGATASTLESLRDMRRTPTDQRWSLSGSWNLPLTAWASAKARGELASDTSYLSDYGKDDDTTPGLNLLKPAQTAKRFLVQEAAVEYYGNISTLSLRVQGARDLLSLRSGDTLVRMPRMEFHLLPRRYFDLPLAFDQSLTFERVGRLNGANFLDLTSREQASLPTAENPLPSAVEVAPNKRRDSDEPYLAGDRFQSRTNFVFPLPANDYVNAAASLSGVVTRYRFPEVRPFPELWPSQAYVQYAVDAEMPLFSEFEFVSWEERALEARLRHDFVPAVAFRFIPEVNRSDDYPSENQTFYSEDNIVSKQEVSFGLRSFWTLFREGFAESGPGPARAPDVGVGNIKNLEGVIAKDEIKTDDGVASHFDLTQRTDARRYFHLWAKAELEPYVSAVEAREHGDNYVWTGTRLFKKTQKWVMQPLSLGVSSSYNFRASQSEREINEREKWRPGQPRTVVEPWGDILLSAAWSMAPLFPLSGSWVNAWSVQWSRWTKTQFTVNSDLPFGLSASFSKTDSYAPSPDSLTQDQDLGYAVAYHPSKWLVLSHAWTKRRKWINGVQSRETLYGDAEFEHTDSQAISFVNIQDCLDITLKRTKDFKQREYQALWSLGINMSFFGQRSGAIEVGDSLNREIQSYTAR